MAGILGSIELSSRGLSVQRAKMNTVAQNIANAETTETEKGGPYRRQRVMVSEEKLDGGFASHLSQAKTRLARTHSGHISGKNRTVSQREDVSGAKLKVVEDPASAYKLVHDPGHPLADEEGYVKYPDIEIVNEMVDMMAASRAYEANAVAISAARNMAETALDI